VLNAAPDIFPSAQRNTTQPEPFSQSGGNARAAGFEPAPSVLELTLGAQFNGQFGRRYQIIALLNHPPRKPFFVDVEARRKG